MTKKITLYQTLENQENADDVELEGPFICEWENSWLGDGYYFWEAFIENAHWWGKSRHKNNYFICEAFCHFNSERCFDLVGDTEHMQIFEEALNDMKKQGLANKNTTVPRIIQYLKDIAVFKYEATRAVGYRSIGMKWAKLGHFFRVYFEPPKPNKPIHTMDYKPPIQFCLYSKKSLDLNHYRIVYPVEYMADYLV